MFHFDEDTIVEQTSDSTWSGELSPRWNVGTVPNGGYQMSVVTRAIGDAVSHPEPLVVTGYYFGRCKAAPITIEVEQIHSGRTTATAMARLFQEGEEKSRYLATFADLDARDDDQDVLDGAPPVPFDTPDLVRMPSIDGVTPVILNQFQMDLSSESAGWVMGDFGDHAVLKGLLQFADGRGFDVWSLPVVCDAFPPAWFALKGPLSWVPTLELTVQIRNRPSPGPLSCQFASRFVTGGYLEEDGEVWDASGQLVAISRQTARLMK